jgi:PAS domain S-box-containing protein
MSPSFQYEFFVVIAPITALVVMGVISFAWLRFPSRETKNLIWLMLGISGWLVFNALEVYTSSETATLFFARITYIFISLTPVSWFVFSLRYAGQYRWIKPLYIGLLLAIPFFAVLLVWTNDLHHFVWQQYRFIPAGKMLALSIVKYGPAFWVITAYNYVLTFGGSILLLTHYFRNDLYRSQSYWLVLGALIPLATNFTYIFRLIPGLTKDYTPISFGLAILCIAIGIVRHRLFDVLPIAREAMVDSMSDAMFALDAQDRVSDCNAAGSNLLGKSRNFLLGQPVGNAFNTWTKLLAYMQNPGPEHSEITHVGKNGVVYFNIQLLPLFDRSQEHAGRLLVLRDITNLRHAEEILQRSNQELRASNRFLDAYAQTIARDLKNPLLTIRASANLLKGRQAEIPAGTVDYLISNVTDNSQKILSILDELLLISNVRSADQVSFTTLNMQSLVVNALKRIPSTDTFKSEKTILPTEWPAVFGKPAWVEEVWVNYLTVFAQSNTPDVTLVIGASKEKSNSIARFWVQNMGRPLPAEERAQLVRTFNELETIRMDEFGLGLSIVKRIMTRLGGEMGMDGNENTRLWFTLPSQPEEPASNAADGQVIARAQAEQPISNAPNEQVTARTQKEQT